MELIIITIFTTSQIIYSNHYTSFIQSNDKNIPVEISRNTEIIPNQRAHIMLHIDYLKILTGALISLVFWVLIDSQKIFDDETIGILMGLTMFAFTVFLYPFIRDISLGITIGTLFSVIPILINRRKIVDTTSKIQKMKNIDKKIIELAIQYGGIITPILIVFKGIVGLEEVQQVLDRYVKADQAVKRKSNEIVFYDFPSVRSHLSNLDQKIIDVFFDFKPALSRVEIMSKTGLSIEALEEAMNRLELNGIVTYDNINDIYRLRGLEIK